MTMTSVSWIFICIFIQLLCILLIWALHAMVKQQKHKIVDVVMVKNQYKASIIVGPSGVGKQTLIRALQTRYPDTFGFSVSHTTRSPRTKETNGIDYHFVTKEEFKRKESNDAFIETLTYCDNYYGTSQRAIQDVKDENKICLLDIHYTSAQKIKALSMDANYLLITTSGGVETCVNRIRNRGQLSEDEVAKRAQNAKKEFDFFAENEDFFDECVWNDDLATAKKDIIHVFQKWYPWLK